MMAAILLRLPTLVYEPNAVPGLTNRLVGKRVSAAAVNFAQTTKYFRNAEVRVFRCGRRYLICRRDRLVRPRICW